MADEGGGRRGGGGALLTPLDVIVNGSADTVGVTESVGTEEFVVGCPELQEGVVVVARHGLISCLDDDEMK
jgi:hypothetical protein